MLSRRAYVSFRSNFCLRCSAEILFKRWNSKQFKDRKAKAREEKIRKSKELEKNLKMGHDIWRPAKRLSWHQIDHLRTLKQMHPEEWNNTKLARFFGISVSAVVRILRSTFDPPEEVKERQDRKAKESTEIRHAEFKKKFFQNLNKEEEEEEDKEVIMDSQRTKETFQGMAGNMESKIRTGISNGGNNTWRNHVDKRSGTDFREGRNRTMEWNPRTSSAMGKSLGTSNEGLEHRASYGDEWNKGSMDQRNRISTCSMSTNSKNMANGRETQTSVEEEWNEMGIGRRTRTSSSPVGQTGATGRKNYTRYENKGNWISTDGRTMARSNGRVSAQGTEVEEARTSFRSNRNRTAAEGMTRTDLADEINSATSNIEDGGGARFWRSSTGRMSKVTKTYSKNSGDGCDNTSYDPSANKNDSTRIATKDDGFSMSLKADQSRYIKGTKKMQSKGDGTPFKNATDKIISVGEVSDTSSSSEVNSGTHFRDDGSRTAAGRRVSRMDQDDVSASDRLRGCRKTRKITTDQIVSDTVSTVEDDGVQSSPRDRNATGRRGRRSKSKGARTLFKNATAQANQVDETNNTTSIEDGDKRSTRSAEPESANSIFRNARIKAAKRKMSKVENDSDVTRRSSEDEGAKIMVRNRRMRAVCVTNGDGAEGERASVVSAKEDIVGKEMQQD